jgi:hypothetical protein
MYLPGGLFTTDGSLKASTDYELYDGRKKYAENCVGGYYAARMSVLEKLRDMKRQALVITLRFITSEYTSPLGVWVCREACRRAFNKGWDFDSKAEMVSFARNLVKEKFAQDLDKVLKDSKLYHYMNTQKTLFEF